MFGASGPTSFATSTGNGGLFGQQTGVNIFQARPQSGASSTPFQQPRPMGVQFKPPRPISTGPLNTTSGFRANTQHRSPTAVAVQLPPRGLAKNPPRGSFVAAGAHPPRPMAGGPGHLSNQGMDVDANMSSNWNSNRNLPRAPLGTGGYVAAGARPPRPGGRGPFGNQVMDVDSTAPNRQPPGTMDIDGFGGIGPNPFGQPQKLNQQQRQQRKAPIMNMEVGSQDARKKGIAGPRQLADGTFAGPNVCRVCGQQCSNAEELKTHIKVNKHHAGIPSVSTDGMQVDSSSANVAPANARQANNKPPIIARTYSCKLCNATFLSTSELKKHIQSENHYAGADTMGQQLQDGGFQRTPAASGMASAAIAAIPKPSLKPKPPVQQQQKSQRQLSGDDQPILSARPPIPPAKPSNKNAGVPVPLPKAPARVGVVTNPVKKIADANNRQPYAEVSNYEDDEEADDGDDDDGEYTPESEEQEDEDENDSDDNDEDEDDDNDEDEDDDEDDDNNEDENDEDNEDEHEVVDPNNSVGDDIKDHHSNYDYNSFKGTVKERKATGTSSASSVAGPIVGPVVPSAAMEASLKERLKAKLNAMSNATQLKVSKTLATSSRDYSQADSNLTVGSSIARVARSPVASAAIPAASKSTTITSKPPVLRPVVLGQAKRTHAIISDDFDFDKGRPVDDCALCEDMCPESEREIRMQEVGRNIFETAHPTVPRFATPKDVMIKKYQKSAAGKESQEPHLLLTPRTLLRTVRYIEDYIMEASSGLIIDGQRDPRFDHNRLPTLAEEYIFIWDRYRMISKEFRLMRPYLGVNRIWIECHERLLRWYIYMEYFMQFDETYIEAGHWQQHGESMSKTFTALMGYYSKAESRNVPTPNKGEMLGYFILMQLGNSSGQVTKLLQTFTAADLAYEEARFAVHVWEVIKSNNYIRFFKLLKNANILQSCLMHKYVAGCRVEALQAMCRGYYVNVKSVAPPYFPIGDLVELLLFNNEDEAIEFVEYCGLEVVPTSADPEGAHFIVSKSLSLPRDKHGQAEYPTTGSLSVGIDDKRGDWLIKDICRGHLTASVMMDDLACLSGNVSSIVAVPSSTKRSEAVRVPVPVHESKAKPIPAEALAPPVDVVKQPKVSFAISKDLPTVPLPSTTNIPLVPLSDAKRLEGTSDSSNKKLALQALSSPRSSSSKETAKSTKPIDVDLKPQGPPPQPAPDPNLLASLPGANPFTAPTSRSANVINPQIKNIVSPKIELPTVPKPTPQTTSVQLDFNGLNQVMPSHQDATSSRFALRGATTTISSPQLMPKATGFTTIPSLPPQSSTVVPQSTVNVDSKSSTEPTINEQARRRAMEEAREREEEQKAIALADRFHQKMLLRRSGRCLRSWRTLLFESRVTIMRVRSAARRCLHAWCNLWSTRRIKRKLISDDLQAIGIDGRTSSAPSLAVTKRVEHLQFQATIASFSLLDQQQRLLEEWNQAKVSLVDVKTHLLSNTEYQSLLINQLVGPILYRNQCEYVKSKFLRSDELQSVVPIWNHQLFFKVSVCSLVETPGCWSTNITTKGAFQLTNTLRTLLANVNNGNSAEGTSHLELSSEVVDCSSDPDPASYESKVRRKMVMRRVNVSIVDLAVGTDDVINTRVTTSDQDLAHGMIVVLPLSPIEGNASTAELRRMGRQVANHVSHGLPLVILFTDGDIKSGLDKGSSSSKSLSYQTADVTRLHTDLNYLLLQSSDATHVSNPVYKAIQSLSRFIDPVNRRNFVDHLANVIVISGATADNALIKTQAVTDGLGPQLPSIDDINLLHTALEDIFITLAEKAPPCPTVSRVHVYDWVKDNTLSSFWIRPPNVSQRHLREYNVSVQDAHAFVDHFIHCIERVNERLRHCVDRLRNSQLTLTSDTLLPSDFIDVIDSSEAVVFGALYEDTSGSFTANYVPVDYRNDSYRQQIAAAVGVLQQLQLPVPDRNISDDAVDGYDILISAIGSFIRQLAVSSAWDVDAKEFFAKFETLLMVSEEATWSQSSNIWTILSTGIGRLLRSLFEQQLDIYEHERVLLASPILYLEFARLDEDVDQFNGSISSNEFDAMTSRSQSIYDSDVDHSSYGHKSKLLLEDNPNTSMTSMGPEDNQNQNHKQKRNLATLYMQNCQQLQEHVMQRVIADVHRYSDEKEIDGDASRWNLLFHKRAKSLIDNLLDGESMEYEDSAAVESQVTSEEEEGHAGDISKKRKGELDDEDDNVDEEGLEKFAEADILGLLEEEREAMERLHAKLSAY